MRGACGLQPQRWHAGVPFGMLTEVGHAITKIPDGFEAHRQIQKLYQARADMVAAMESEVDWAMAEALAFGTLIAEGNHVRLSGQVRPPCLPLAAVRLNTAVRRWLHWCHYSPETGSCAARAGTILSLVQHNLQCIEVSATRAGMLCR